MEMARGLPDGMDPEFSFAPNSNAGLPFFLKKKKKKGRNLYVGGANRWALQFCRPWACFKLTATHTSRRASFCENIVILSKNYKNHIIKIIS
jgi:hypothetical protein